MKNDFKFIDLFAGIGGFRLGLSNIGGTCINFSETNKEAITTYCLNYNEESSLNLGDITKIKELPLHDLLTGGVPCQSWSIAGKNLGFDDDRGQLWNDTIYLLNKSKPKSFIFENVKGLVDQRNKEAFESILKRIEEAGYFAKYYLINSFDYGIPQSRVRVYIIGFKEKKYFDKFELPSHINSNLTLSDILDEKLNLIIDKNQKNKNTNKKNFSLSSNSGFNDYFSFNDLRNGQTTIHSWDILKTTQKQKNICLLLLKNRRKKAYGPLDGNPLSLKNFQELDSAITQKDLDQLIKLNILKSENYSFSYNKYLDISSVTLTDEEKLFLSIINNSDFIIDSIINNKTIRQKRISVKPIVESLIIKNILSCNEIRYDFKNTKISTGLFGVNRIFLANSSTFPTLVASDTNDYIATVMITAESDEEYKQKFIEEIYNKKNYRKISKSEACKIQGFPSDFKLPEHRAKWMKLIGNSVSVPVIEILGKAILETGVFDNQD